jgi:hypothetical protein
MATEASRQQFGMTDKGQVVVIEKQSYDDSGDHLVSVFEVRHGVRTVGEYPTKSKADNVAKALVA